MDEIRHSFMDDLHRSVMMAWAEFRARQDERPEVVVLDIETYQKLKASYRAAGFEYDPVRETYLGLYVSVVAQVGLNIVKVA